VRRRLSGPIVAVACTVVLLAGAASARAAPVLVLGPGGHASVRQDPFVAPSSLTPAPAAPADSARAVVHSARSTASKVSIASTLTKLYRHHEIDAATYHGDHAGLEAAIHTAARLRGTRAVELYSILTNMHDMAVAGELTPSRLPVLFLTLNNNRQWWSTGPLLSYGQRVQFAGSELVWEYYPGQGIELQVLGSFSEADAFYTAGPSDYPKLQLLLSELIPLAVQRGGGLAWEYYFRFDGGRPPWVSAMAQGTALEALARAYQAFNNPEYLTVGAQALALFTTPPPAGVKVATRLGARYLQYSFAPRVSILNAFLQSLIGLYDFGQVAGNTEAEQLFNAGNAEAQAEVPHFNTGAWSLYEPGDEDPLSYHELVTGFLQELCTRTQASVYCTTGQDFQKDLTTPPALTLQTHHSRVGVLTDVHFWLSKPSRVGIVEVFDGSTIFATSADLGLGGNSFGVPTPRRAGVYTVRLAATDLAGNFNRIIGTIDVAPAGKHRHPSK
jgi:hypothetical protein